MPNITLKMPEDEYKAQGGRDTSDGKIAGLTGLADSGLVLGITNMGEKATPVVSNATPPAGQSQIFSSAIKSAVFQFANSGAAGAIGLELFVVFGALDDADAKNKLDTAGLRHIIPLGDEGIFPFPDAGGPLRFDFAVSSAAINTKVSWEVTI